MGWHFAVLAFGDTGARIARVPERPPAPTALVLTTGLPVIRKWLLCPEVELKLALGGERYREQYLETAKDAVHPSVLWETGRERICPVKHIVGAENKNVKRNYFGHALVEFYSCE